MKHSIKGVVRSTYVHGQREMMMEVPNSATSYSLYQLLFRLDGRMVNVETEVDDETGHTKKISLEVE